MSADTQLAEILGPWDPNLPACEKHAAAPLAGFCTECGKPVCAKCAILSTEGIRCVQCVPAWQARMQPATRETLRALHGFATARSTLAAFVGLLAFVALLVFSPALLRPSEYEPPVALMKAKLRAPYIEKAYRLRIAGDTMAKAGDAQRASDFYRRAAEACRRHLSEGNVSADQEAIVQLGLGQMLERQGEADKALEVYRGIIARLTNAPPAGVASFYVGRILETVKDDKNGALENYQRAFAVAAREGDALNAILDYHVAEQENKTQVYALAALLDTATHPRAFRSKLAKGIERLTGSAPGEEPGDPRHRAVPVETEETFEIVLGR